MIKSKNTPLPQIKAIVFDFDGVLCHDWFYASLGKSRPNIHKYIQKVIFGNNELVNNWMRNKISSDDINRMISDNCGIEFKKIKDIFEKDIYGMRIDNRLVDFAKKQSELGRKIGIVTDNMDVFSSITIKNHRLDNVFGVIVNSSDYGLTKKDKEGKLFDILLNKLGVKYKNTLLIDDSLKVKPAFEAKGGNVYTYTDFDNFINWANVLK